MSNTANPTIGFIGGGNMASSLIGGLLDSGTAACDILVIEPAAGQRERLQQQFGVETSDDITLARGCSTVVLAVKPQVMREVCSGIEAVEGTLYISVAAGIPTSELSRWLAGDSAVSIIRCMPNTPALLQCGATGLFANAHTSDNQRDAAQAILEAVGIVVWVESEDMIDAVTAVSGSGPAYYFLMMEAMQKAGESLGLPADVSRQLVLQTALGAARMATQSDDDPATLRHKVTSKGGTTEQAINSFQSDDFENIVRRALTAARDRGRSLAEELSREP